MKNIILFLFILVAFQAYSQRKMEYFHPNGIKKETGVKVQGKKDGLWMQWNKKGEVINKVIYKLDDKQYEEKYNSQGILQYKIYYKKFKGIAFIEYFNHRGICVQTFYSPTSKNSINLSASWENKIGHINSYNSENGKISYTLLKNILDRDYKYYLTLPHYSWNKGGRLLRVGYDDSYMEWFEDGRLRSLKGPIRHKNRSVWCVWNENGELTKRYKRPLL